MSGHGIWERVEMAWTLLGLGERREVSGVRREAPEDGERAAEPSSAEGFSEEALPCLDAVYAFALRLTSGNRHEAEDLVQETFLKAHRAWESYERGTQVKSWLFTICRNTYLQRKRLARNSRERAASDLDARIEALSAASAFEKDRPDPEDRFFDQLIDDEVIRAIDELPEEYREALVLSDLGDLRYAEVAEVLDVPVGTVKSRLFRARRLLQERLRTFAAERGYIEGGES